MATRLDLRCRGDVELESKLLSDAAVRRVVESAEKEKSPGVRRELLATALRVTKAMSPRLDGLVQACREKLGVETQVESYVYPDARFNAGCVKPEDGRVFVLFSSALFEAFDDEELRFVAGHELGHHLFNHHKMPLKPLLESSQLGPAATQLFAWSRYAEISADRAGLVCAGSLDGVSRSLLKLASGLKSGLVQLSVDEFLRQLGDMQEEVEKQEKPDEARPDWFATHPFSPLRLQAAQRFVKSAAFAGKGDSADELEAGVAELMSLMEPTYLAEKTETAELMRRLLLAGGVLVAAASGDIDAKEKAALEKYFGPGSCDRVNVEALRRDLERRCEDVRAKVPALKRTQVLRDIALVALADGHVQAAEREVVTDIARRVEADLGVVERTLAQAPALD